MLSDTVTQLPVEHHKFVISLRDQSDLLRTYNIVYEIEVILHLSNRLGTWKKIALSLISRELSDGVRHQNWFDTRSMKERSLQKLREESGLWEIEETERRTAQERERYAEGCSIEQWACMWERMYWEESSTLRPITPMQAIEGVLPSMVLVCRCHNQRGNATPAGE